MKKSHTAVVERNVMWEGHFESEPFETAWASEAIYFVRVLEVSGDGESGVGHIQISPDGIHWVDEGTEIQLPETPNVAFARIRNFGGWLRLVGEVPQGTQIKVILYLALKE